MTAKPEGWYCIVDEHRLSNGDFHREDGPALTYANGDQEWWLNNELHRVDGPAVIWENDEKEWWLFGKQYDPLTWLIKVHKLGLK